LFFQFISFIEYKKDFVINEEICHNFLQNGIESENQSKEWAAHLIDSMYEKSSNYTARQLTDEDKIPEEIEELLTYTLAPTYSKFKKFEKTYKAKSHTVASTDQTTVPNLITTKAAVIIDQNKQQGEQIDTNKYN